MVHSVGALAGANCVCPQHTRILLCAFLMKNISYLNEAVRMRNVYENPLVGWGPGQGRHRLGKRSPELIKHAGHIWMTRLGQGGARTGLPARQEGWGRNRDRVGPVMGWEVMVLQMTLHFLSISSFSLSLYLRKSCNETDYGTVRLIISFCPLREEGGKYQIIRQSPFKELLL